MSKITAFFKRPSTSMTHATDNDNSSLEKSEPPNKKASKSGSRKKTLLLILGTGYLNWKGRVKLWRKYGVKRVEKFPATALLR